MKSRGLVLSILYTTIMNTLKHWLEFLGSSISSFRFYQSLQEADFTRVVSSVLVFYVLVSLVSVVLFTQEILIPIKHIVTDVPEIITDQLPDDTRLSWNGSVLESSQQKLILTHPLVPRTFVTESDTLAAYVSTSEDLASTKAVLALTPQHLIVTFSQDVTQPIELPELLGITPFSIDKRGLIQQAQSLSENSQTILIILQSMSFPLFFLWHLGSRILFLSFSVIVLKILNTLPPSFTWKRLITIHTALLIPAELVQIAATTASESSLPYFGITFWLLSLFIYIPVLKASAR